MSKRQPFQKYRVSTWPAKAFVFFTTAVVTVFSPSVYAAPMDGKQMQIVSKVFNFLEKKPPEGSIAVVLPGAAEATSARTVLSSLKIIEGDIADTSTAFAVFVNSASEATAAKGQNAHVLTIGPDVACVDAGACVLAIVTQPKLVIYVSRAAAASANIEFDVSFKMLITER